MLVIARSMAAGVGAFAIAGSVAWLTLFGFAALYLRLDIKHELAAEMLAALTTLVTLLAFLLPWLAATRYLAALGRADFYVSLAIGAVAAGVAAYWALVLVTVVNGCALGVPFPLNWDNPCGR